MSDPKIEIFEIADVDVLEREREAWNNLLAAASNVSPYVTPEFMLPWLRSGGDWRCRFLVAKCGNTWTGLAPFAERRFRRFLISCVVRAFPMHGTTPAFDIVIGEHAEETVRAFARHLKRDRDWDALRLHRMPSNSTALSFIPQIASEFGLTCRVKHVGRSLTIPIEKLSWDEFMDQRSRNLRKNLRRAWRDLEELGNPRLISYPSDGLTFDATMGLVQDVINRSWKGGETTEPTEDAWIRQCASEFARRDWLSICFLMLDDKPIAFLLMVEYRYCVYAIHTAYDLQYQRASPGTALMEAALRTSFQKPYRAFDFSGSTAFLEHWTEHAQILDELCMANSSLISRVKEKIYIRVHERRYRAARITVENKKRKKMDGSRPANRAHSDQSDPNAGSADALRPTQI